MSDGGEEIEKVGCSERDDDVPEVVGPKQIQNTGRF